MTNPKQLNNNTSILQAIATALSIGDIDQKQAKTMRANIGVTQASFTRKQTTKAQRKNRSKMQKASRKLNR